MDLELNVRTLSEKKAVIEMGGRLNASSAQMLKAQFDELVKNGHVELICDFTGVGFLDNSGLSVIVSGLKASREGGGWLKLAGLNEEVGQIFKITRLDRVFEMFPNVEAALS